jgi:hypothetical protein
MRRPCLLGPLLISLTLLSLVVLAGCGGTATSGTSAGGLPTSASAATAPAAAVKSAGTTTTTTAGATPTSGGTAVSSPDAGVTSTSPGGMPIAITPEEIKNAMSSVGMGSPDQLQIYDYKNFGHYAAAYVMAADENVYLVLFNDETGGWAILDAITGLDWEAVQADLRAKSAPEDLIEWANPGEE